MTIIELLAKELNLSPERVEKTVELLDEGNTIPFIARYRKEVTGGMDDITIRNLDDRLHYLRKMDERRAEITKLIDEQGKLTDELAHAISLAKTLVELEDLYLPYRPKRKTRASVARDRGLEPLAALIMEQRDSYDPAIMTVAADYINEEKGVPNAEGALAGALDIIAEDISNDAELRKKLRLLLNRRASLHTVGAEDIENSVYAGYADYREPVHRLPGHRILAVNRGEREGFLKVTVELDENEALAEIFSYIIKNKNTPALEYLNPAMADSYDRLLFPSLERELRTALFDNAGEQAIHVFADNLRNLLMGAPLKGKTVMGYDPGFRTGCKLAVVDKTGKVLETAVIYPTEPRKQIDASKKIVSRLVDRHKVDVIAIGNGTASRESEQFIADLLPELSREVSYTIVSESGASVYSASKLAQDEFPDFDVTERSAVSIARRLQDPLAELVKIDPKAIGVGQYQHDMKEARLTEALDGVVEGCVNAVGVDINTASHSLLSHIAGINATAAKNIVSYREENGEFTSRAQILKVPKIGAKAYTQCAGFLRVSGSSEILDATGVHPESYALTKQLLSTFEYTEDHVREGKIGELRQKCQKYGMTKLAAELGTGVPTLEDILSELEKPGRDIRDSLPPPQLRRDVLDIKDLKVDMLLTGTVRNVVDFGVFVDIGVHQDGLLHISEMADRFVRHPRELLSVGDIIEVRVKSVDPIKKRIGLTRKKINTPS